jgi:hypothetical protein
MGDDCSDARALTTAATPVTLTGLSWRFEGPEPAVDAFVGSDLRVEELVQFCSKRAKPASIFVSNRVNPASIFVSNRVNRCIHSLRHSRERAR